MEVRCDNKKHAVIEDGVIQIRCGSAFCGKRPGVVVLHMFDVASGNMIDTKRFKDPIPERG